MNLTPAKDQEKTAKLPTNCDQNALASTFSIRALGIMSWSTAETAGFLWGDSSYEWRVDNEFRRLNILTIWSCVQGYVNLQDPGPSLVWLKAHSLIMFKTWPLKGIRFLAKSHLRVSWVGDTWWSSWSLYIFVTLPSKRRVSWIFSVVVWNLIHCIFHQLKCGSMCVVKSWNTTIIDHQSSSSTLRAIRMWCKHESWTPWYWIFDHIEYI